MSVPVSVFNTSTIPISVSVNNGPQFAIAGAPAPSFTPQSPRSGGPTFGSGFPGSNVVGLGLNYLTVTPQGSSEPMIFQVDLPESGLYVSIQLYLSWHGNTPKYWLLNNGIMVGAN